jgi:hypothetical protein
LLLFVFVSLFLDLGFKFAPSLFLRITVYIEIQLAPSSKHNLSQLQQYCRCCVLSRRA